jgi:flagellar basal-body rod modification protein FlgD
MGKDDFMKLLMAQLQNQDPLNPMDHQQFATQLAQFTSLEKLTNIGTGIDTLHNGMGEDSKLQAIGMIGKKVLGVGSEIEVTQGVPVSLKLDVKKDVQPTKISIWDGSGKLVREVNLDPKKNNGDLQWDGKNQEGIAAPSGKYFFRVVGTGLDGKAVPIQTELTGKVIGVEMQGKDPMLWVETPTGKMRVELSKIQSVLQEDDGKTAINKVASLAPPPPPPSAPVQSPQSEPEVVEERVNGHGAWNQGFDQVNPFTGTLR